MSRKLLIAVVLLALLATACGSGDDAADGTTDDAADPAVDVTPEEDADDAGADDAGDDADADDAGADDAGADDAASAPDAPDFGVTSDTVRIGWMGDVTGPTAAAQGFNLLGAEAAVAWVNENGGVLGRELELVVEDDQYSPETMTSTFASLTQDNPVLAIIQCGNCTAMMPDFASTGIPLISPPQTVNTQLEVPNVFNDLAHYADQADAAIAYVGDQLGSVEDANVAVVHLEVPSGAEWDAFIRQSLERAGGNYVGALAVNVSAPDFASLVTQLGQMIDGDGVNYVAFHGAPEQALGLISEMVAQGRNDTPVVGIHGLAGNTIYTEGPPEAAELLAAAHSFLSPLSDCEMCATIRDFVAGTEWEEASAELNFSDGWHEILIAVEAAERAAANGDLSWEGMVASLSEAPFDVGGLTCDVDWTQGNQSTCIAIYQWDEDHMEPVRPFEDYADVLSGEYEISS